MKFELTEKDESYIKKINDDIESGENDLPLFVNETDRSYFFEFKAVDIAKANAFACTLMNPNKEFVDMMRDVCGINVTQISYVNPVMRSNDNIISILEDTLAKLKGEI